MGTSDCPLFPMESPNSPPKPTSDFQELPQKPQQQEKDDDNVLLNPSLLTIKTSNNEVDEDEEEGSRTPTSSEQRIPMIPLSCPKAPKKPKTQPSPSSLAKRKAGCRRRILLDLTAEVDSLFPPSILADLGGKMKKVRKLND